MKKRLRKKLHKGEFQQYGISIMVPANADNVEATLDVITDIANHNNILFCGGGLGRFIVPSKAYGELKIPSKLEFVVMNIALVPETLTNCIIGYFINPFEREIRINIAERVEAELKNILKTDFKINCRVDLWN
ncbi:MAG: hypothetical protein AB2L20_06750 [Mangrovibacterium sp.]